jgi:hypothetical protein
MDLELTPASPSPPPLPSLRRSVLSTTITASTPLVAVVVRAVVASEILEGGNTMHEGCTGLRGCFVCGRGGGCGGCKRGVVEEVEESTDGVEGEGELMVSGFGGLKQ